MLRKTFLIAGLMAFASGNPFSAHAGDAVQAVLDEQVQMLADHFQINPADARMAVDVLVDLAAVQKAAKADPTGVSDAQATFLQKRATVLIVGSQVVHEGEMLITLAERAIPGTPVPPDISDQTTAWLNKAGQYELLAADLDVTGSAYVTAVAMETAPCAADHNAPVCIALLKQAKEATGAPRSDAIGASHLVADLVSKLSATRLTY